MTSLNRPAPRSPHTPDAIGSVFYAAMCDFAGFARGACLRVFSFFGYKTRAYVIECVWLPPCAALDTRSDDRGPSSISKYCLDHLC